MRLLELHLDRFGCFTDRRLTFRPDAALTVIYGANEAGKSTALAAIADVLYGIEDRSQFRFQHDYPNMRIGATIADSEGKRLSFRRRKGKQNTLLDTHEAPLPEDALAAFLGNVDRNLFLDAFGLNRARLRAGAKQLIDGGGRVGETLLAAAPGLSSLIALRASLAAEADELFPASGRKVSSRPFWQACDSHAEARKRVRHESLQADTVRQAHSERDEATEAVNLLRQEQRKLREEASRLGRLKTALPRLRRIDDLEAARKSLGALPEVADDFPARCRTALDARRTVAMEAQRIDQEIAQTEAKLQALGVDDALLGQADAVERLADQRGAVVKADEDRRKLAGALEKVRADLDEHARRLGLADRGALLARRPPDSAVARARTLLAERRRLRDQIEERRESLSDAAAEIEDLARRRDALGHIADPAPLRRQLDGLAVLPERIDGREELARSLASRQADLEERLGRLVVSVTSADDLARLPVPDAASVEQAIEHFDAIAQRRSELDAERQRLEFQKTRIERRIGELEAGGDVPTEAALSAAREAREALWQSLRPRLLGEPLPEDPASDLAHYEAAVGRADTLADRRQKEADRIASFRSLHSELCDVRGALATNATAVAELETQARLIQADWVELWGLSQLTPKSPREMRGWLRDTADILRLRSEHAGARARLAEADGRIAEMTERLARLADGAGIGKAGLPTDLLNSAAAAISSMETTFQDARVIAQARENCERRKREFEAALGDLGREEGELNSRWADAAASMGLSKDALDEEAEAALAIWQAVPALAASMKDLEHRIARMEQDWDTFEAAARSLCGAIAPDLTETEALPASAALRKRLF
jgi:uncharacterized protein YhaN